MKTKLTFKKTLLLSSLGVLGLTAGWAQAANTTSAPTGYFRSDRADILVEAATEGGVPVNYALVLRNSGKSASLFRIEELDDGTQSWIRLHALSSGVIGADEDQQASYTGQVVQDGSRQKLILTPISQNRANSADRIEAKQDKGLSWSPLPESDSAVQFGSGHDTKVFVSRSKLIGDFSIGDHAYHGTFSIDPVVPGVGALRAEAPDSEASSGRSLQRSISGLVAVVNHQGFFGSNDCLELIQITDQDNGGDAATLIDKN